ncbi:anaphase promoting complex subunit 2 [Saccharomycopsis crataegensis]|uniref:Anaphase-promoting complex subunit 2 n=1 Tax=Saccharomycopsis crataegensis TaxID=43959 RepID=A0AAV5QEC1_9ASCO|nr:anaphase promoting complex subunit 2 [Saccharomycopsis crataegensis]
MFFPQRPGRAPLRCSVAVFKAQIFPAVSVQPQTPSQEISWNNAVEWLNNFNFHEIPSDEVQISLKNLSEYESEVLEVYLTSMRRHFFQHEVESLKYSNSQVTIDENQTVQIIHKMRDLKKKYFFPLQFIKLRESKLVTVDQVLNGLFATVLLDETSTITNEDPKNYNAMIFVENLKHLFGNYFYHNDETMFSNIMSLVEILVSANMANAVKYIVAIVTKQMVKQKIQWFDVGKWDEKIFTVISKDIKKGKMKRLLDCYIFCGDDITNENVAEELDSIIGDELLKLRIDELYEIVGDFPRSSPALEEINDFIKTPAQRSYLVSTFGDAVKKNLLHPGATTISIISFYISMIKSLLIVDPKGVLLDRVCRPIRRYLKERHDTIKFIVSGLLDTEDHNHKLTQLSEELKKAAEQKIKTTSIVVDEMNGQELYTEESLDWAPDPIDALPDFKRNKVGDIIEAVTSLFDSKNFFINEFIKHFSRQLINIDYDIDIILSKLNLLKAKFGNSNEFDSLDVMVRDIIESKNIDSFIQKQASAQAFRGANFHSTVLSYLFWPNDLVKVNQGESVGSGRSTSFILPTEIQKLYDDYSEKYSEIKLGRQLKPVHNLGKVTVELELKDRVKSFQVTPDVAMVIYQFNDDVQTLDLDQITEKLQMDSFMARKACSYWVKEGILEEVDDDEYRVLETEKKSGQILDDRSIMAKPMVESDEKDSDNKFKEMEVLFPFINGMLTNLGSMEVAKIKSFLSMAFPAELNVSFNEAQLEEYLNFLVDEDKLEMVGNKMYKLRPAN